MRLIDADALIEDVDGDLTDSIAEGRAIEKIMNAPTVEAIPIEWLKEHIVTIEQGWILEDWEREHETTATAHVAMKRQYFRIITVLTVVQGWMKNEP